MEQFKEAHPSSQYKEILILYLDVLNNLYYQVQLDYSKSSHNENNINNCICQMIVILNNIYPKIEGGGIRTESLLAELKPYMEWTDNILIPKVWIAEKKKIHTLYQLILKAYDLLGLTSWN